MVGKAIGGLVAALVCTALVPAVALAQPAPAAQAAQPGKPYFDLYDAMIGGMDLAAMADIAADSIFDGLVRKDPALAAKAKAQPQLRDKFRATARPYLRVWLERSSTVMRSQIAQKLATKLTPAEASEFAEFYGSPLGQKVLKAVTRNLSLDASTNATLAGKPTQSGSRARTADERATMNGAMTELLPSLTPAEQAQMLKYGRSKSFPKLPLISEAFQQTAEPTFDEISTAEEREGFKKALSGLFAEALASGSSASN